jgi:hypothetical protein
MRTNLTIAATALLGLLTVAGTATAQEALDPALMDPSLKGLVFGATKDQVAQFVKDRMAARYDTMIQDAADIRDKDRLAREKVTAVAGAANEWVSFEGKKSGWDASIVRDEFGHGLGEEMLHVKDGETHYYLFFAKGALYKLVRTGAARPVAECLDDLKKAYGPPAATAYQDEKTRSLVKSATWKGGKLALAIEDRTRLYQCALVRWTLAEADAAVKAERARAGQGGPGMSPLIKESKGRVEEEGDPVDAMIGAPKPPRDAEEEAP